MLILALYRVDYKRVLFRNNTDCIPFIKFDGVDFTKTEIFTAKSQGSTPEMKNKISKELLWGSLRCDHVESVIQGWHQNHYQFGNIVI